MAGESAGDLARRQREKAQRLLQSAERWEQGAAGERATGEILDGLTAAGWIVFHDVRWPGRQRANIDHVVVGPPGVFVIDSKNWSGRIDVRDNTFRAHGRRQDKVVAAAGEAALAVTPLTSSPAAATTRAVLCFVRDEAVTGWCHDVMVCSTANLREMLTSRPPVLDQSQVRIAAAELQVALRARPPAATVHRERRMVAPRPPAPVRSRSSRRRRTRGVSRELSGLVMFLLSAGVMFAALPHLPDLAGRIGDAIAAQTATGYDSCRALRQVYPEGVGSDAAVAKIARKQHRPAAQQAVYDASRSLDTDGDGLICVRRVSKR